ncbi:tannase and feruloyl esterase [Mycena albidolilacea]|uniref:Carboxylic ester hydrolase n=1 Tax=Mycena albidolilacea TaxID=1033008 RepID=A0AAD6Z3C2_9AGAR|nr:tannase and feruloyl esterase [Mycena albidolilacea]
MILPIFLAATALFPSTYASASVGQSACLALQDSLHLENTTILNVTYIPAATTVSTPASCQSTAQVSTALLCRVYFVINTTSTSAVHAEAWLPDTWFGRFLGLGNGGLGGCIDYANLDYGTSLHFAAVASDNGHDGNDGHQFLNNPEIINDFAFRALHVEVVIGKQIVQRYYGAAAAKSYYLGCSTGGRQGTQAALKFPDDFDGIVAGSPATDFNHLTIAQAGNIIFFGRCKLTASLSSGALWAIVSEEVLRQCDALDGLVDGIITEPDECDFRAEAVQCTQGNTTNCITPTQVETVKNVFSPIFGLHGELVYPRYSPGAEGDPGSQGSGGVLGGPFFSIAQDWGQFAILNVTSHDFSKFSLKAVDFWDSINPGGIATFDGDLSAFRNRGGKFLTYHGRRDPIISSTNSKRVYDLISHTLSIPLLDDFYRLFLIPGMGHCSGGLGPTSFGQSDGLNLVNDSAHNILLAMVDWVEGGIAPATIIGSDANATRTHCRYPMRSVFNGTVFVCE